MGGLLQVANAHYVCRAVLPSFILHFFLFNHLSDGISRRLFRTIFVWARIEILIKDDVAVGLRHE